MLGAPAGSTPRGRTARLSGVDGLRGLAALAVFVCHIVAYWNLADLPAKLVPLSQVGAHGVDVFVVLSGFCLALPVAGPGRTLNIRQFFGRRAWRILPAYWVALTAATVLALAPATWPLTVAKQATAWDVIVHVLGLQTIVVQTLGTINGSLWSISLELCLYAAFPLAVLLWRRWGTVPLLVLSAVICIGWAALGSQAQLGAPLDGFLGDPHSLPARWVQFVMGMVVARAWTLERRLPLRTVAPLTAVLVLVATLASTWVLPQAVDLLIWALAGGSLVYLFATLRDSSLLTRLDTWGRRSFSFYLVHQPTLLVLAPLSQLIPGGSVPRLLLGGPIALVVVSAIAEVLYRGVELPSHRRGRRAFPQPVRSTRSTARQSPSVDPAGTTPI